jgi:hypothetical protein
MVTDNSVEIYLNGTIFDPALGYKTPNTPITALNVNLTQHDQIMVDASTYTADSFLSVLQGKHMYDFMLTN